MGRIEGWSLLQNVAKKRTSFRRKNVAVGLSPKTQKVALKTFKTKEKENQYLSKSHRKKYLDLNTVIRSGIVHDLHQLKAIREQKVRPGRVDRKKLRNAVRHLRILQRLEHKGMSFPAAGPGKLSFHDSIKKMRSTLLDCFLHVKPWLSRSKLLKATQKFGKSKYEIVAYNPKTGSYTVRHFKGRAEARSYMKRHMGVEQFIKRDVVVNRLLENAGQVIATTKSLQAYDRLNYVQDAMHALSQMAPHLRGRQFYWGRKRVSASEAVRNLEGQFLDLMRKLQGSLLQKAARGGLQIAAADLKESQRLLKAPSVSTKKLTDMADQLADTEKGLQHFGPKYALKSGKEVDLLTPNMRMKVFKMGKSLRQQLIAMNRKILTTALSDLDTKLNKIPANGYVEKRDFYSLNRIRRDLGEGRKRIENLVSISGKESAFLNKAKTRISQQRSRLDHLVGTSLLVSRRFTHAMKRKYNITNKQSYEQLKKDLHFLQRHSIAKTLKIAGRQVRLRIAELKQIGAVKIYKNRADRLSDRYKKENSNRRLLLQLRITLQRLRGKIEALPRQPVLTRLLKSLDKLELQINQALQKLI